MEKVIEKKISNFLTRIEVFIYNLRSEHILLLLLGLNHIRLMNSENSECLSRRKKTQNQTL